MMEYPKRTTNGDAGEYLVAHRFTRVLGWPYRMLDVDLGVDGEVEILDASGISTSDIIKVQVKTFESISSEQSKGIYVTEKHIEYWKRFCLPIIMVCVDLSKGKVYWKAVTATECYKSGGASQVVSIDLRTDELTAGCAARLKELVSPAESKNIELVLDSMRRLCGIIKNQNDECVDVDQLGRVQNLVEKFESQARLFDELAHHFPWRCGVLTRREVEVMRRIVTQVDNKVGVSYNNTVEGM
ncbi:DUF4365 domain-containing protein [Pseudomonas rhodesiae]|uniref:DUF4365 domain-containing protein n=1 Tax=Pseudomonas TaxID=286 RepID=UPI0027376C42|nr:MULTISPECIES: DUF4365 domain-containing protein [Pseudomonas]MEA1031586.1 DUF4365 domain-containing protein [Pseudomonas sp. N-137]WLI28012.1 DUF4365 domain-containing protein [Pseudomonas rhodesiae]